MPLAIGSKELPGTISTTASSTIPNGWLLCDGTAVSRTTFATLFSVVGVTYGVGDGVTTFNLPDLQGRAILGVGSGAGLTPRSLGDSGGDETDDHNHSISFNTGIPGLNVTVDQNLDGSTISVGANNHTHPLSGSSQLTAASTIPPFLAVNYIIKI